MEDPNKDTLRVLVATDSHLGYMEKDEVRKDDSFNAFDEICAIAAEKEVDFLLLGGDLFHENKPSRTTLIRTIEILRRYCLNDRPVQFQVVSDQTVNFPNRFGHVNYEDPHYNVGLPVFSIHGNHDDPAGVDNLSAIDILASCNLINYFGKVDLASSSDVGQIALHPILLRKGFTKVALYGLGNIRDERLNRMFQTPHAVQWIRPASQDDCLVSDWFNIFVIHQNRVKANPKNAINEHFLARFLDFVIWGHEHECLIDPQQVPGMGFHVSQPGSSVATSLIEGEAAPKHVLLLEIKGNHYRPTKIPLQSVRPFLFADVSLKDDPDVDPNDPDSVVECLTRKVQAKIAEVPPKPANDQGIQQIPLVRLRVDYTGYSTINPQRFGQRFVGKVANPNDILLFTKAARARKSKEDQDGGAETLEPEELNQQNIEALLAESNLKMEILPVNDLGVALHDFVNKDEKQAFHVCVHDTLEKTQTKLAEESVELKEEKDVMERVVLHMKQRQEEYISEQAAAGTSETGIQHQRQAKVSAATTTAGKGTKSAAAHKGSVKDFSDDDDDEMMKSFPVEGRETAQGRMYSRLESNSSAGPISATRSSTGRGQGGSRGGGRYKQTTLNLAGTGGSQPRASGGTTSVAAAVAARNVQIVSDSDEEEPAPEEDNDSDSEPVGTSSARGRKRAAARGRGGRAPATRAKRGRKAAAPVATSSYIEDDVEDDDEDGLAPSRGRGSKPVTRRTYGALRK